MKYFFSIVEIIVVIITKTSMIEKVHKSIVFIINVEKVIEEALGEIDNIIVIKMLKSMANITILKNMIWKALQSMVTIDKMIKKKL